MVLSILPSLTTSCELACPEWTLDGRCAMTAGVIVDLANVMSLPLVAHAPPLRQDGDTLRVGGSNVALEVVLAAFNNGDTPDRIVQQYPTLDLADVYDVVAYYLRHPSEVAQYLAERQAAAAETEAAIRRKFPNTLTRAELESRQRR
jgi:uncharacterized protein (DUF433 family)